MSAVLSAFQYPSRAPSDLEHPRELERFPAESVQIHPRLEGDCDRSGVGIDDRDDPGSLERALEGVGHAGGVQRAVRAALQGWVV